MRIALKKESGEIIEKEIDSAQVTVGRSNKCDFMIADESLSRQHCLIELENGEFYITDLGSSNGVFIDGDRLPANTRTLYNSFNELSVGIFECTIQDSLDTHDVPRYHEEKVAISDDQETKIAIKFPSAHLRNKTKKEKEVSKLQLLVFPILIAGAVIFYYATGDKPVEQTVIIPKKSSVGSPDYKNNIQLLKEIPNQFKSPEEYINEEKVKTCALEMEKFCLKMKLNPSKEGFYRKGKNLTIYLEPSLYENELRYYAIKALPDKAELIALDKVLASQPMSEYFLGQNMQVHIVIKDGTGRAVQVIRFHPVVYSSSNANRMDALKLLEEALQTANIQNLWAYMGKYKLVLKLPTP